MVIEVKTHLNKSSLRDALDNIKAAKQLECMAYGADGIVFAFKSHRPETIIRHLQQYPPAQLPMKHVPAAILLFDRKTIIHCWTGTEVEAENVYEVRVSKDNTSAVVVAFLLLLFFDVQMQGTWGGADIANMMQQMLEDKTEKIAENIRIGVAT